MRKIKLGLMSLATVGCMSDNPQNQANVETDSSPQKPKSEINSVENPVDELELYQGLIDVSKDEIDFFTSVEGRGFYKPTDEFQVYEAVDGEDISLLEDAIHCQYKLNKRSTASDCFDNPQQLTTNCQALAFGLDKVPETLKAGSWDPAYEDFVRKYAEDINHIGYERLSSVIDSTYATDSLFLAELDDKSFPGVSTASAAQPFDGDFSGLRPGDIIEFQKNGQVTHWVRVLAVDTDKDGRTTESQLLILSRNGYNQKTQVERFDEYMKQGFVGSYYGEPSAVLRKA